MVEGDGAPRVLALDDGRRLAWLVQGEGSPTVVLEAGLGADAADWAEVQAGIAGFTRVLRYDRAGRGASDAPATLPRRADALVADLHALLHTPGLRDGPCVMVGHSFGGLLARLYAAAHAKDVAGLVLAEAMHEEQFDLLGPAFPPPSDDEGPALKAMRAFWCGGWRDPAANEEGVDLAGALAAARGAAPLGRLPLAVLTAGGFVGRKLFAEADGERLQALWGGLQNRLTRLAEPPPGAVVEHVVVEASGHFMQRDAPQAVVSAVQAMVERLRQAPP